MSKREKDGEISVRSKHQKPNDDVHPKEIAASAEFANQESPSPILKLNAICCDDLFEWLSLENLYSLGQTCKRMQRLAGIYFQQNFTKTAVTCKNKRIIHSEDYYEFDGFIQFVRNIHFSEKSSEADFQYIGANCDSLRNIFFHDVQLTESKIDFIKQKLDKVERMLLYNCKLVNLYEGLLKLSSNLKNLNVKGLNFLDLDWMCEKYPKLQHLSLTDIQSKTLGQNLHIFLQQNPQLESFECDHSLLLENSDKIINSKLKLDTLKINTINDDDLDEFCTLLNQLYDNGIYKRLEFGSNWCLYITQARIDRIRTLHGLETLFGHFEKNITLPPIISLKELFITDWISKHIDFEAMSVAFPNLRFICLRELFEINRLLLLTWRLSKLKDLYIHKLKRDSLKLDLSKLNEERKKLNGACKLTIHVTGNIYMETKMSPDNLYNNHDLIQIKRIG